jgi:hypothetical protein
MLIQITQSGDDYEAVLTADETGIAVGDPFRLIGRTTRFIARTVQLTGIAYVYGITPDGRRQTIGRLCDVVAL